MRQKELYRIIELLSTAFRKLFYFFLTKRQKLSLSLQKRQAAGKLAALLSTQRNRCCDTLL
ncbi:hypothetical protein, partial [Phascolarctobacterium succinatutens]|uniref:hypothetical protein n=1 Tax=Phascolarctobacterium succinatutens TaxID=626940 RepID=UPI0026EE5785